MLMVTGMIPLSLVTTSAAGGEPGQGGGAEGSSTAVTAPTSFGKNAEPIDEERPAAEESHEADQDVLNYWTHERMAEARPMDTDTADDPAQEQPEAAEGDGGSSSSTDPAGMTEPVAPAVDGGGALPARTKGKLFFNGYPIDRGKDKESKKRNVRGMSAALLDAGVPLLIYPEGSRSRTGAMAPFKPGREGRGL